MQKIDRRIQRTQQALMDALVAMSLEQGYDSITIRDLAERANVAYSTFFRHYASLDDLLAELLQAVIDDMTHMIDHNPNKSKEAEGRLIFQHVADHEAFFRILFSSQGTIHVVRGTQETFAAEILHSGAIPADSPIPAEIAANHYIATVLALIEWWLKHDMPYPIERMAVIYSRLIAQGFLQIVTPEQGVPDSKQM